VVRAREVIVYFSCVVVGINCGLSNSRYRVIVLCCVCVRGFFCGYSNNKYSGIILYFVFLVIIVVTATVDIVQWYCVVCVEFIVVTAK